MTSLRIILAGAAAASLGALIPNIAAADAQQAIGIAATHAGLAANAGNINVVHTHMHHVLNCLVGPGGDGFDAMAGNPCGMAGGAIPQENNAEMKTKLLNVAAQIRTGIGESDMDAAKKIATAAQTDLRAK
ncbi:MAG: hypothetical protein KGO48_04065 [Alphaproteobacteria bacterium]|nr:hypothetical protein [Alphaproteobacteria bacterium]